MTEATTLTKARRVDGFGAGALALALSFAVVLPPLLFVPIQIHAANPYDFSTGLNDLLAVLAPLALIGVLGIALLQMLARLVLPHPYFVVMTALLLALAILLWLQGQVLVWDYGVLDGGEIHWSEHSIRAAVDWAVWLVVPGLCLLVRYRLLRLALPIGVVLLLFQGVPAVLAWNRAPEVPEYHRYNLIETHKFDFSREHNVIMIVLDAFQSDIFQRLVTDNPDWRDDFEGFTYFRNALAGYSKTYPSLALMLAGQWYDNDRPVQAFIKDSFLGESLPHRMMQAGWRVDLFPPIPRVVYPSPRVASNTELSPTCRIRQAEAGKLVDLGLFRLSPQTFKSVWLNDYQWRLSRQFPLVCVDSGDASSASGAIERNHQHGALEFLEHARKQGKANLDIPSFKLYHLMIPHAPFRLDESLEVTQLPDDREGFEAQSAASIRIMALLLARLREIGAYDNSLIAIVSDHGGGEYTEEIDWEALGETAGQFDSGLNQIPPAHLVSGLPLLLVKPPHGDSTMRTSDAPVSLADLARTIAELANLSHGYPGRNMFEVGEDEVRTRRYRYYRFEGWSGEYLPEMTEYDVTGFSWNANNWRPTGQVLSARRHESRGPSASYRIGETVRFRPGLFKQVSLGEGWSVPSAQGLVWSNAREAELSVALDSPVDADLVARFDLLPFTGAEEGGEVTIRLMVNGNLEQEWVGSKRKWFEMRIPAEVAREDGRLHFRFEFPDAAVPAGLGLSPDTRLLGAGLYRMQIDYHD